MYLELNSSLKTYTHTHTHKIVFQKMELTCILVVTSSVPDLQSSSTDSMIIFSQVTEALHLSRLLITTPQYWK